MYRYLLTCLRHISFTRERDIRSAFFPVKGHIKTRNSRAMDNAAFRKLVADRTRPKSTKEIAREAVEDEFKRKGRDTKRGRRDGYDSDSDGGGDEKKKKGKYGKHQQDEEDELYTQEKKKKQKQQDLYRDRAKERREGNENEYASSSKLLQDIQQAAAEGDTDAATLSKYLGGDEAHTHLVKGLDVALARKIKREMGKAFERKTLGPKNDVEEEDLEKVLVNAQQLSRKPETKFVKNIEEAKAFLLSCQPSTPLGKCVLAYLHSAHRAQHRQDLVDISAAGLALHRTSTIFSTLSDPLNVLTAWEIPQEVTQAAVNDANANQRRIPLNQELIQQIQEALGRKERKVTPVKSKLVLEAPVSNSNSDDDDIFADAGRYVPPTKPSAAAGQMVAKGLIFSNLLIERQEQKEEPIKRLPTLLRPVIAPLNNVIDRDVLGARSTKPIPVHQGVGIASYQGDYGEEMDTDFTGRDDDEEDEANTKNTKRGDSTDAAREYGRKQKKTKPPSNEETL